MVNRDITDNLSVMLFNFSDMIDSEGHYLRIRILYHQLRDNYLKQGDQTSADAVMYELGWQREIILEPSGWGWWKLYGHLFGYGY